MARNMDRRHFLRAALSLGAGSGLALTGFPPLHKLSPGVNHKRAQDMATAIEVTGKIKQVHDPAIIKAEDAYYLFCTGVGIPVRKSVDLVEWQMANPIRVFSKNPEWTQELIPGSTDFWAPDIVYYNDKYHLYYSVSTFGKNRSLIGLATNLTLDKEADEFEWVDEGVVIESVATDNYNCIDPNFALDADGNPWLVFGSFWTGIKMLRLDPDTAKPADDDPTLYALAQRSVNSGAVEAPFIIRKGDFYYLFVSFDFCCRGVDSTYHVMVGRSETFTGPYADRDGVDMLDGGGTQVTFPTERWRGPGHNSILQEGDSEYIVYHAYDANNGGMPTLRIDPLVWDADGWPSIEAAPE